MTSKTYTVQPLETVFFTLRKLKHLCSLALVLIFFTQSYSQTSQIKGKLKDKSTGEELIGVSVVVKGKTNAGGSAIATATDANGEFILDAQPDDILIISYLGFKTIEIKASEVGTAGLSMEQDTENLDEVVVVGYGTADKRDISSSLAKINSRDFNKGLVTGADGLIEGKVAGLQVSQSGEPGGGNNVLLRGQSLNGQRPLYVVDGIILDNEGGLGTRNPLNFLSPNDIESMTVLKDAAATAIYGVRGANGVIQITTKVGKTGKPVVTYDASVSVGIINKKPDIMDAADFRAVVRRKKPDLIGELGNASTDWIDEVTRAAVSTQHNVGVSGGFKKTNYYASVNYINNQGVLRKTSHDRINIGIKLNQKLFKDNLIIGVGSKIGIINDELGPNVFGDALRIDPTRPVRNADGSFFQYADTQQPNNPVALQQYTNNRGASNRFLNNYSIEYKLPFLRGLSLFANGSLDLSLNKYSSRVDSLASASARVGGISSNNEKEVKLNTQFEYYATYKKSIKDHSIEATAGYGYYDFLSQPTKSAFANNTFIDAPLPDQNNRLISFFARTTYNYKGKYFLTASLRRDGSSKFGPKNRWGYFPSASVGWRILEEDFAIGLRKVFHELKIRASYGVTGNDQIGNYLWLQTYTPSKSPRIAEGDTLLVYKPNGSNPEIRWEKTESYNVGLDIGFFKGRLTSSIEFYRKNVSDLLYEVNIPAGTNYSSRLIKNIGAVTNQGVEVIVNAVPIDRTPYQKNGFRWNLMYNIAYNQNKITKLDEKSGGELNNFLGYPVKFVRFSPTSIQKVGLPVDAFYTYEAKTDANGKLVLDSDRDGIQNDIEMYKDQNKDGIINENDKKVTGKPNPDLIMGLTSSMSWKNFDFQFTLKAHTGNSVFNAVATQGYFDNIYLNDAFNNLHRSVSETKYNAAQYLSNYYVQNAAFLKLTNVTLGYNIEQIKFMNLRAYLTGQNLLFITPYSGVDPEVSGNDYGVDNVIYPRAITFTAGISATFK